MAATLKNINETILSGKFSSEELDSIIRSLKAARADLDRRNARTLSPGSVVSFSNKYGVKYQGTIESIKIKNAIVRTDSTLFRVPMSMLTAA